MFHQTSKMSISISRYFQLNNKQTLALNYTLNYIHNFPPSFIGGSDFLIDKIKEGIIALIDETQYICFICITGTHWYLIVVDCGSSTMNIFNSYGTSGNNLAINKLLPFLLYMGSFGGPQFN